MQYDFDEIVPRRGSCSCKWDNAPEGVLPLWVADMDFKVAQPIVDAMQKRLDHGIFGYTRVPDEYYEAAPSVRGGASHLPELTEPPDNGSSLPTISSPEGP